MTDPNWAELTIQEDHLVRTGDHHRRESMTDQQDAVEQLTISNDKSIRAQHMGSEGWAVFVGPKMVVSNVHEDAAKKMAELQQELEAQRSRLETCQQENEKQRRLLEYAGGILAHGTPGSAWMDWLMRAQGVLGLSFHESRYRDGNAIPLSELKKRVGDLPRVHSADLKEGEGANE